MMAEISLLILLNFFQNALTSNLVLFIACTNCYKPTNFSSVKPNLTVLVKPFDVVLFKGDKFLGDF